MTSRVDERVEADETEDVDVAEHGRSAAGEPTTLDRRLFVQLHAFGGVNATEPLDVSLVIGPGRGVHGDVHVR